MAAKKRETAKRVSKIAEKKKAKNVAKGKKYIKAADRIGKKSMKTAAKASVKKAGARKTAYKSIVQAKTADNLKKVGSKAIKSKGQGSVKKRKELKVTRKSAHNEQMKKDKTYTGEKKWRKAVGR